MTSRDEEFTCTGCGARFLFSAVEAQLYEQRGLAPPKRCKECRRARKQGGPAPSTGAARPDRRVRPATMGRDRADGRGRPPTPDQKGRERSATGDVNEYRSPMTMGAADGNTRATDPNDRRGGRPGGARGGWRNGAYVSGDGVYRSPAFQNDREGWAASSARGRRADPDRSRALAGEPRRRLPCDHCGALVDIEPTGPIEEIVCAECRASPPRSD